jgi:hypothetical protein
VVYTGIYLLLAGWVGDLRVAFQVTYLRTLEVAVGGNDVAVLQSALMLREKGLPTGSGE